MSEQLHTPEYQPQRELLEQLLSPQPTVVGLEGGPCSGKTTLMGEIERQASETGQTVVLLPEAATQHIERLQAVGRNVLELAANNRPAYVAFQKDVMRTIVDTIQNAKREHAGTDAVIVIDRPDLGAYVTPQEHREIYGSVGLTKPPIHTLVDKLIFMPSVACEDPEAYDRLRRTNSARLEASAEEAAKVSNNNLRAIKTHPELHIAWGGDFQAKMRCLAAAALEPETEGEIKLAVKSWDADELLIVRSSLNWLSNKEMFQSYHVLDDISFRLRESYEKRGRDYGDYFLTVKTGVGPLRREVQRRLTQEKYLLLKAVQQEGNELHKRRTTVLDRSDETGRRRQWFVDEYYGLAEPTWHAETDVYDQEEYDEVAKQYQWLGKPTLESAKTLIFN